LKSSAIVDRAGTVDLGAAPKMKRMFLVSGGTISPRISCFGILARQQSKQAIMYTDRLDKLRNLLSIGKI